MKIGLIVECTNQGLESIVCPKILEFLAAEAGVPIEPRNPNHDEQEEAHPERGSDNAGSSG